MSKFNTDIVDAFEFSRLYNTEKYSLQKMELKSVNFPAQVEAGKATATWSDRVSWDEAIKLVKSNFSGDAFFAGATDASFIEFAKAMGVILGFKHVVTGARVTRYTNAMSGYPCLALEITSGGTGIRGNTQKIRRNDERSFDHHYGFYGNREFCDE